MVRCDRCEGGLPAGGGRTVDTTDANRLPTTWQLCAGCHRKLRAFLNGGNE